MNLLEKIIHWLFAIFMAALAYAITFFLTLFLLVKLTGVQTGIQPPSEFQIPIDSPWAAVLGYIMIYVPLMVASFVGACTAPNSQKRISSVVFPLLVFILVNSIQTKHGFVLKFFLESGASCAAVGLFLYFQWKRQQTKGAVRDVGKLRR